MAQSQKGWAEKFSHKKKERRLKEHGKKEQNKTDKNSAVLGNWKKKTEKKGLGLEGGGGQNLVFFVKIEEKNGGGEAHGRQ